MEKILVIKLSALGDFVIALGAMKAIRDHHPDAHITLLTTNPYKTLAEKSGYFNEIWIDNRPKVYNLPHWFKFKRQMNDANFTRIYDLQNNDRTGIYFNLFSPKPEWVGATKGASHFYDEPDRTAGLPLDGLRLTLKQGGIDTVDIDPMDWMEDNTARFKLPNNYALIVAGAAPSRPEKRWPAENYASLCQTLNSKNITPVLIGTESEKDITASIMALCPNAINLAGQTTLFDLVPLARNAKFAVGNDTGPMHMIAPTGCHTLTLFSNASNPRRNAPMGENVQTIQVDNWQELSIVDVLKSLDSWL